MIVNLLYSGVTWVSHGIKSTLTSDTPKPAPRSDSTVGLTSRTKTTKMPMEVLQLFLTMVLLQSIVKYSNNFAASKGATLN